MNPNKCASLGFEYNGKRYPCGTSLTMGLIGGKWKSVILFYLLEGPCRYSTLRNKMPEVTERTLSLQLKQLENDGLISRKVYISKPPMKVEYSLTDLGRSLDSILRQLASWGSQVAL